MKKVMTLALCVSMGAMFSCATKSGTGAAVGTGAGAGVGAGIGALIGGKKGAIIGAGVGGVAGGMTGAAVGAKMDRQEAELKEQVQNAEIERTANNQINVRFDSGILFDTGSAALKMDAKDSLDDFANVLSQYPENILAIEGHTDSTGSRSLNERLSEQRAASVRNYLQMNGVSSARMTTRGYADTMPVATNATSEGRAKNRRVEIKIVQEVQEETSEQN